MTEFFGHDVDRKLNDWWKDEFLPEFYDRYGKEAGVYVVVLNPAATHDWRRPLQHQLHVLSTGDGDRYDGPTGLRNNVAGKLAFCLRTGLPSIEAEADRRPDLLVPGDFPWEGSGSYEDYWCGGSGLDKAADWTVVKMVVRKVIELRTAAAQAALLRRDQWRPGDPPSNKYLGAMPL